jgi:anhydro-N-acetylmuramic acid kinase
MHDGALKPLTVAGVMSGTSADGVDVAIVRIEPGGSGEERKLALLHHHSSPYPASLRDAVLAAMDAQHTSSAELARLNWRLGLEYANQVKAAIANFAGPVDLIGCHGQTIYHQGSPALYADREFACTWQLGEATLIADATGLPVVSNFRPADMAAGGQGAPLVPYLDYALFRHATRNRILQNLGGIGNLTAIPAAAGADQILAFDTGPANMIVDELMQKLFDRPYDKDGLIAARGRISTSIVTDCMQHPFFLKVPPKSAGREQFGERYATQLLALCESNGLAPDDTIATATALTVESIRLAVERFVMPRFASAPVDFLVAGGGSQNLTMMTMLTDALTPLGATVSTTDTVGLPSQSKEAAAFALLAYETWHHRPSNVPAATGATRPAILGQVTYYG